MILPPRYTQLYSRGSLNSVLSYLDAPPHPRQQLSCELGLLQLQDEIESDSWTDSLQLQMFHTRLTSKFPAGNHAFKDSSPDFPGWPSCSPASEGDLE